MEISSMDHVVVDVRLDDGKIRCTCVSGKLMLKDNDDNIPREKKDDDHDNIWIETLKKNVSEAEARRKDLRPIIYKVPDILRELDPNAYEPQVISLGPYHHGKHHLKAMEEFKLQYLYHFLSRKPGIGLSEYISKVKRQKSRLECAYSGAPYMKENEFIEMMLLDACFVLEFLFPRAPPINNRWDINFVCIDMMRLENQVPFFLLKVLLELNSPKRIQQLTKTIYEKFWHIMPGKIRYPLKDLNQYDHILHLLVSCIVPESGLAKQNQYVDESKNNPPSDVENLESKKPWEPTQEWVPCASNLHELGVAFRRMKKSNYKSFTDIAFKDGIMDIPPLQICRVVIPVFRNLIAFEQCRSAVDGKMEGRYVTAYAYLMDFIINTPRDVQMLNGIIQNTLGNDKEVASLFNSLCVIVQFDRKSYLSNLYKNINNYCEQGCHRTMATLRHDYFHNPWARVSVIAAILLFLLTAIQAFMSIFSYVHPK